jgi:hypothetical protein
LPLWVKFVPWGKLWSLGKMFTPSGMNTLYCLEKWRGKLRLLPLGDNFTPEVQLHPWWLKSGLWVSTLFVYKPIIHKLCHIHPFITICKWIRNVYINVYVMYT